jgi:MFS family permease
LAQEQVQPGLTSWSRRTFSSLWVRNFRLFFVGQLISNTGNWLTIVALTLLVLHRTGSGIAVGALAACQYGPILLLTAWAGLIADRSDKRHLLYVTQSLEMFQSAALAALAFMHDAPLPLFFVVAAVGGCLLAFDNPGRRSFVSEMRSAELHRPPRTPRGKRQVREGLAYVARVPELWITFLMLAVIGALGYNFTVVFPIFVEHGLHGSDAQFSLLYASFSAGALVGALLVARRTMIGLPTVIVGAGAFGLSMLVLAIAPNIWVAYAIAAVVGGTSVAYTTATTALAQLRAGPGMVGRVLALQTVLLIGTTPIGGPVLGAVADSVGSRAAVLIGGVATVAAAGVGLVLSRRAGYGTGTR